MKRKKKAAPFFFISFVLSFFLVRPPRERNKDFSLSLLFSSSPLKPL